MTIASLVWGGYALSDAEIATSVATPLDAEFTQNSNLISKNFAFDGFGITVKAKKHVNLSLLVNTSKEYSSDPDKFLADFQEVRQAKYPNEEIELVVYPKSFPEKSETGAIPKATGYQYLARAWYWNKYLYYGQGFGYAYSGVKGVIATLHAYYGIVRLDLRLGNIWYAQFSISNIGFATRNGYSGIYGGRGVCLSSSCKFDIMTFFPY